MGFFEKIMLCKRLQMPTQVKLCAAGDVTRLKPLADGGFGCVSVTPAALKLSVLLSKLIA